MKFSPSLFPSIVTSIAALSVALLLPASAQVGSQSGNPYPNGTPSGNPSAYPNASPIPSPNSYQTGAMQGSQDNLGASPRGSREAMRMVPARAVLKQTLDADSVSAGFQFRATLAKTIHLDNGPELPSGTVLLGNVATDDMNQTGKSKLALRFTQAVLKNGQTLPIKATIVSVYKPEEMDAEANYIAPGDEVPNSWNDGTLQVDQIGVMSGVDLHSKIASRNSGVFVSTKGNVKLPSGSELALAIAAQHNRQREMGGTNGSPQ